jgi:hypothetical protein
MARITGYLGNLGLLIVVLAAGAGCLAPSAQSATVATGTAASGAAEPDVPGTPALPNDKLSITDNLSKPEKELVVEAGEWKAVFSLYFNGAICRLFDKVHDPGQQNNLLTGPEYCQGGLFDYDVYLEGNQEFSTAIGRNESTGRATVEILESSPVRLRVLQRCHPRLNNGNGPRNDRYIELDMVETTTEWTFYPTGRVYIKFDAVTPPEWNGTVSRGPGGDGDGIDADGTTIMAVNGTSFMSPWVTKGDTIESASGKWGPVHVVARMGANMLKLSQGVPKGTGLDFVVKRPLITNETISIHAGGDKGNMPHTSLWQGGSNGVPLFTQATARGDIFRGNTPPVSQDYVYAQWTRPPGAFGSLLAFYEPYPKANYAVFNDLTWSDLSYTQVGRGGSRPFEAHHRHFLAQMGTEAAKVLPRIKSVADAVPFADDYLHPYAEARTGTLGTGPGISAHGFDVTSGAYSIAADEKKTAAIAFDSARARVFATHLAYRTPAILLSGFDVPDERVRVELSQDNGATFQPLATTRYNMTTHAKSAQLGGTDRRLVQLLSDVPAVATGARAWVLRVREEPTDQ